MKYARLKATKRSLYKLICDTTGMKMPAQHSTEFVKAPRDTSWWLKWDLDGVEYSAFFLVSGGAPLLAVSSWGYSNDAERLPEQRRVFHLDYMELDKRGMVELVERRGKKIVELV